MYSKVLSGAALGIDAVLVTVETDISTGLPGLSLVGYLASSVKEAGDRVRAALKNIGYFLPSKKIPPCSGFSKPSRRRISVDLPQPEGPTMAT